MAEKSTDTLGPRPVQALLEGRGSSLCQGWPPTIVPAPSEGQKGGRERLGKPIAHGIANGQVLHCVIAELVLCSCRDRGISPYA